jgi:DNA-binding response OmpR family regulator
LVPDKRLDVLLVEDHELVRDAVSIALELAGLRAVVATDLSAAGVLACAQINQPRVVLLDYFLDGDQDSLPLIGPLTELGARVLMLTGAADGATRARCLAAGALDVLDKSGGLEPLIAQIRAAAVEPGDPVGPPDRA